MPSLTLPGNPDFFSGDVLNGEYFTIEQNATPHSDISVVCGGSEICTPDYCMDRDGFPFYGIEFIAEGECDVSMDGQLYRLPAGSLFFYSPKTKHVIRNSTRGRLVKFFVDLQGTAVPELLQELESRHQNPCLIFHYRWIHDLFLQLVDCGKRGGDNASAARLLVKFLLERVHQLACNEDSIRSNSSYVTFEKCRSYLRDNFETIQSINELAEACFVTRTHLCRLFRQYENRSPSKALVEYKMMRAAELLASHGLMIKEVADRLAFDDPYYFSRAFKRYFGISPKAYKEGLSNRDMAMFLPNAACMD